jgi:hypothetical protein
VLSSLKIVVLLYATHFQVQLPELPPKPDAHFTDNAEGIEAFATWLRPQWYSAASGEEVPVFCVIAAEPLPKNHRSPLALAIGTSSPPIRQFEPFSALFRVASSSSDGFWSRTMSDAIRICMGERL